MHIVDREYLRGRDDHAAGRGARAKMLRSKLTGHERAAAKGHEFGCYKCGLPPDRFDEPCVPVEQKEESK